MAQTYSNLATTTLASNYTVGDTTLALNTGDGALFPSSGDFIVGIDSPPAFFLKCTSRSGDTLTVVAAAQEGTTRANKSSGTAVTQVITAGALDLIRSDMSKVGVYSSLPVSGMKAGDRYKSTDNNYDFIYDGSAWVAFVGGNKVTVPPASTFSWVNQGAAIIDESKGRHVLTMTGAGGRNVRARVKSAPSAPYTITALVRWNAAIPISGGNDYYGGLCWRNSSSGKIIIFGQNYFSGWSLFSALVVGKFTGASSFDTTYQLTQGSATFAPPSQYWMRIADDNTNRICSYSNDGYTWFQFHSVGRTDYFTADQVGFFVDNNGTSLDVCLSVESWLEA